MIKKILYLLFVFTVALSLICIAKGETVPVKSISMNNGKTLYLTVDDYITLDVKINPESADSQNITFYSSKPNIADVDYRGNVTAKKVGTTVITAELDEKKSSITVKVSSKDDSLGVNFTVKEISGTEFKEISVTPYRYDDGEIIEDEADDEYLIYLPTGYCVEGKSTSYVADKNGVYPFTIYYKNDKRTFYCTVEDIESIEEEPHDEDRDDIEFDYKLMYDYEETEIFFNMRLDKVRTVITPDKNVIVSNNVNYYIDSVRNNTPTYFTITVDDVKYDYMVIKQGEFYLLVSLSPVYYNNYSLITEYYGYNFSTNEKFKVYPSKDIIEDNGNYEVVLQSDSLKREVFNYNIDGLDFRRPSVSISLLDNYTLDIDIEDDFGIDYIITFDGKYVSLGKSNITNYYYNHKTNIDYNGEYLFIVGDKSGNRSVESVVVDSRKENRKHAIDYDVHKYRYTKDLFKNTGMLYEDDEIDYNVYKNILPSYMNGTSSTYFNPDSPITRAEMITMFCRVTDLPYDTGAYLKNKFIDIDNHWAKYYISMGSSKRYVSGYKDKTFRPNSNVTRAEFCEMLDNIRDLRSKLTSLPASSNYNYIDINDHWAKKEIVKIISRDILTGYSKHFYPDKPITRSEVVHAINMLYDLNPSEGELKYMDNLYKKYYSFKDIDNHKYYNDIIISVVGMYKETIN